MDGLVFLSLFVVQGDLVLQLPQGDARIIAVGLDHLGHPCLAINDLGPQPPAVEQVDVGLEFVGGDGDQRFLKALMLGRGRGVGIVKGAGMDKDAHRVGPQVADQVQVLLHFLQRIGPIGPEFEPGVVPGIVADLSQGRQSGHRRLARQQGTQRQVKRRSQNDPGNFSVHGVLLSLNIGSCWIVDKKAASEYNARQPAT